MISTDYQCDKCKVIQNTAEQFWTITIGIRDHRWGTRIDEQKTIDVCRPCLESFGLAAPLDPHKPPCVAPTIEDLIREIVQSEVNP